tara:strand:+ start:216 stop:758 length:543 start_codon:yes stop_codon:yes gene_type:complete
MVCVRPPKCIRTFLSLSGRCARPGYCGQTKQQQSCLCRPCYILYWGADADDIERDIVQRINFQTTLGDNFYARDPMAQCFVCRPCRPLWIKVLKCYDSIYVRLSKQKRAAGITEKQDRGGLGLPMETLYTLSDSTLIDQVFVDTDDFIPIVLDFPPQIEATITWSIHTECVDLGHIASSL